MSNVDMSAYYYAKQHALDPMRDYLDARNKEEQQKRALAAQVLAAYISHPDPDARAAILANHPEIAVPEHETTPEDQYNAMVTADKIAQFPQMPKSVRQAGTYQSTYGAALPKEMVDMIAANDVYGHPQAFAPQMQGRQAIADKMALDANQQYIELPKAQSEIAKNQADTNFTIGPRTAAENALAGERRTSASKNVAETGKIGAQTKMINAGLDAETGQASPAVMNAITTLQNVQKMGGDPTKYLTTVIGRDKVLYDAVMRRIQGDPQYANLAQPALPTAQRTALAEIDPIIKQAQAVLKAYEPYKEQNGLMDRDTVDYLKYRMGTAPPDDSPASQLANLQMLQVQAGARLLKGGSRAYPALQMAMQHAGNGAKDTRKQIYDKTVMLLKQLENVRNAQIGGTAGEGQPLVNGSATVPQPSGTLHWNTQTQSWE